jgi:hypothetical protein
MRNQKENRLWYFRVRGYFYALGPIQARSAAAARRKASRMGFKPIAEVWETAQEEIDFIIKEKRRQINEFRAAGKETKALMIADI